MAINCEEGYYDKIALTHGTEEVITEFETILSPFELVIDTTNKLLVYEDCDKEGIVLVSNRFKTMADLVTTEYIRVGEVVELLGYYELGDGAGHRRIISEEDDDSGIQLDNGKWANIFNKISINIVHFGVDESNQNNSDIIRRCTNYARKENIKNVVCGVKGQTYKINKPVDFPDRHIFGLSNDTVFDGNGSTLEIMLNSDTFYTFYNIDYNNVISGCTIKNFRVKPQDGWMDMDHTLRVNGFINATNVINSIFKNNYINTSTIQLISSTTATQSLTSSGNSILDNILDNEDYKKNLIDKDFDFSDLYTDGQLPTEDQKAKRRLVGYGQSFPIRLVGSFSDVVYDKEKGTRNNTVSGNTIRFATYSGTELAGDSVESNLIENNYYHYCEGSAVECDKGASYNKISNNNVLNIRPTISINGILDQAIFQDQNANGDLCTTHSRDNVYSNNSATQTEDDFNFFRTNAIGNCSFVDNSLTLETTANPFIVCASTGTPFNCGQIYTLSFRRIDIPEHLELRMNINIPLDKILNLNLDSIKVSSLNMNTNENATLDLNISNCKIDYLKRSLFKKMNIRISNCSFTEIEMTSSIDSSQIYISDCIIHDYLLLAGVDWDLVKMQSINFNEPCSVYQRIAVTGCKILSIDTVLCDLESTHTKDLNLASTIITLKDIIGVKDSSIITTDNLKVINCLNIGSENN